ncbi:MAG: adenylate kinase [Paramuribaculum sp.]|nr:adenylate kinase [Paramuribaculum sp.]
MFNIVVFGAPGSGKGTQSAKLIEKYGLHHISTGDVLRQHIKNETELGKIANEYISKGQLIPDNLMIDILEHELDNNSKTESGVIFDGFPRTIPQAIALDELLERRGAKVNVVVGLELDDDELIDRMLKRGQETGRADDNIETITNRLKVYHNQTQPLKEFYHGGKRYHKIKGHGHIDSIFADIAEVIDTILKENQD